MGNRSETKGRTSAKKLRIVMLGKFRETGRRSDSPWRVGNYWQALTERDGEDLRPNLAFRLFLRAPNTWGENETARFLVGITVMLTTKNVLD
jgi:hypothetical protein